MKKAGLVDTLSNAQNITVFAPTNDAFAKIPKATLDKVLNDKAQLTVCGNVKTANANVYIIDSVLMPTS